MEKKREYLRKSFENYDFVVNYAERNEQCVERIETELQICRDFVQILPSTLGFWAADLQGLRANSPL